MTHEATVGSVVVGVLMRETEFSNAMVIGTRLLRMVTMSMLIVALVLRGCRRWKVVAEVVATVSEVALMRMMMKMDHVLVRCYDVIFF